MKLHWADCRLDPDARTLERAGAPVHVQPLAFDLLALLLRHRGRVVTEAYIRRALWPDVTVGDASLRQTLRAARRAIGDDGRAQIAIETVRGRGLRFVAPVASEGGADDRFVGRGDVLAVLERDLDETEAGRGGATLVVGRAGIGKTSTLLELAARAETRGWRVLPAFCRAGAEDDAYALWIDVARALGLPALTESDGALPASAGISESNRFARYRAVERAIASRARAEPLLLCFDDLQFADRESLALLRFLAPTLRATRARILGGHRPLAAGDAHVRDLAGLAAASATRVVELRGLDADEVGALVRAHFAESIAPNAAGALAAQTDGSPLLVLEVVRALLANATRLDRAEPEEIAARVAVGLVPLVRRRLAALEPATRRVLHAAAAIGDPVEPQLVRDTTGSTLEALEGALLDAEHAGLVEREGSASWRFAHPLFAEAVAEDLATQGADANEALHLRIFQALDASVESDAFRSASHALRARRRLPPELVVDRLRLASRAAWRMYAVADAETWQQRAVEIAEESGLPALERCDLLQELGDLATANSGINAARTWFDRAARIAQEHGDRVRLTQAALGYAHRTFALDAIESVLAWLQLAHAEPCGNAALEARVAVRLGAELLMSNRSDVGEADRLLRDGIAQARHVGDALTLGRVLADQSIAVFSAADRQRALGIAREVVDCGRHAHDVEIEFRGLAEIATLHLEMGDRPGLERAFEACERFVEQTPIPYARGVMHGIAAMRALLDARLDDARTAMDEAERYARATGSLGLGVVAGLQRFQLARESGELQAVLPALGQARARFPEIVGLQAVTGLACALCGDAASAREAAEAVLERVTAIPNDRTRLATLAVAAELAHLTRSSALAAALEPLLVPVAASHAVAGNAATYWGSMSHALGLVAATQGRRDVALRHFTAAQRAHEALQSPVWTRRSADRIDHLRRPGDGRMRIVS